MSFTINKEIELSATSTQVWQALTTPQLIKQYLFGTNAVSEWKEGSSIEFRGSYEGTTYVDKGVILDFEPGKNLKYSYLSSFSNLEDTPENYSILTFTLTTTHHTTTLRLTQENILNEKSAEHSAKSWEMVLAQLKNVVEKEQVG